MPLVGKILIFSVKINIPSKSSASMQSSVDCNSVFVLICKQFEYEDGTTLFLNNNFLKINCSSYAVGLLFDPKRERIILKKFSR